MLVHDMQIKSAFLFFSFSENIFCKYILPQEILIEALYLGPTALSVCYEKES